MNNNSAENIPLLPASEVVPIEITDMTILPDGVVIVDSSPTETIPDNSDTLRDRVVELWHSVKVDYKNADRNQKTLMVSAAIFQLWNQSRLQQAVTIPAAISIYIGSDYNEWLAAGSFAGLNYVQQFGASGTLGAASRAFPNSLETSTREFPGIHETAIGIEKKTSGYVSSLYNHTLSGQALGAAPYVLTEVLSDPKGTTKATVMNAEKVSRRIAVGSGVIALSVLKLAEEYPTNDTVQRITGHAQNPLVWMAIGVIPFVPAILKSGVKSAFQYVKAKNSVDEAIQ